MKIPYLKIATIISVLIVALYAFLESNTPCDRSVETDVSAVTAPAPRDAATPSDIPRYSLQQAIDRGMVEYEVIGTGASSGQSLFIGIRNTTNFAIDVFVLAGTIFTSGNSDAQRMVAWGVGAAVVQSNQNLSPVTSMYLPDNDRHLFVLEAYCLDFQLANPAATDSFTAQPAAQASIVESLDVRAAQIIREGKKRNLTISGIQSALWMDHEHITKQEIKAKFDADAEDLDKAFTLLQTLPPPKSLGAGRQTVMCK